MGKSASGKNHIADALLSDKELNLRPVVIYTTRPMRAGEANGVEYNFVSDREEEALKTQGKIIEERVYHTVHGDWKYFTADDGSFDSVNNKNLLAIGTPEAYDQYKMYFGEDRIRPIYVEVSNGHLLGRAVKRESKQKNPNFEEVYRRFQADKEDFAEEKLKKINKLQRFSNDESLETCIDKIKETIMETGSN